MDRCDVAVVGAGLAGLVAGLSAARAGAKVVVLDAHHPGGRAQTDERDGFLFNRGPHALYEAGAGMRLLKGLGVEPAGVAPPLADAWVRLGTDLHRAPLGATGLMRTTALSARSKARLGLVLRRLTTTNPASVAHLTARQYFDSLEMRPDLDRLIVMLSRLSSYCASTEVVSADVVVSQITASMKGVRYLHGGWGSLCRALSDAVVAAGGQVRPSSQVLSLRADGDSVTVETALGSMIARSAVLAAGLPQACAGLLAEAPEAWRQLASPVTAACLDLGLAGRPARSVILGLDRADYAICHGPPADLAPDGSAVVHAMRYLAIDDRSTGEQLRAELDELVEAMGIGEIRTERFSRRMVVVGATPTPDRGGLRGRPDIGSAGVPGLFVAGDWAGPDGFLADAAIASGAAAGAAAGRAAGVALVQR